MSDLKSSLQAALRQFTAQPLEQAARNLLATLGYTSDRTVKVDSVEAFSKQFDPANRLLRLTADSPDLLAVIKAEGRV
ncbi:MAG TPA: hypothetical protein PKE55_12665 [Kiritimatiellia bacterium]|nr:hypothetical protein [Kiritimatiellia bacterium]